MGNLTLRPCTVDDLAALTELLTRYTGAYPGARVTSAEFYLCYPQSQHTDEMWGVLDDKERRLVGFAQLTPVPAANAPEEPHHLWTGLVVDPAIAHGPAVRELLLGRILERARALSATLPPGRVRLAADMAESQEPDLAYLLGHGFERFDGVYTMQRLASAPLPDAPCPVGVSVRCSRMALPAEQQQYLDLMHRCYPRTSATMETLHFLLRSSFWRTGTAVLALDDGDHLVGSVLAFWHETAGCGYVDDVRVLPEWRRRGVGKCLLAGAVQYFRAQQIETVQLDVGQNNLPALALYRAMGFTVIQQVLMVGRFLSWNATCQGRTRVSPAS